MLSLVAGIGLVMAVIMAAGWITQRITGDAGWADAFWSLGTGAACAAAALMAWPGAQTWRQIAVAILIAAWSARLGFYIARRVARGGEDVRYRQLRQEWGGAFQVRLLGFMLVQAPVSALLGLAVLAAAHNAAATLRPGDIAGAAILVLAVAGESLADTQMARFRASGRGGVCRTGLWAWSRHPNYFFEWLGWCAWPVIALPWADGWAAASLLAPAAMFLLLRFGSGTPPLEAAMLRSKGDAYRRYQAEVSPFLPLPPRSSPS